MPKLYDKETGEAIGDITPQQLRFLTDQLEEESLEDRDYYINRATLEMFEEDGVDPALLQVLRRALGDRDEMEVEWADG